MTTPTTFTPFSVDPGYLTVAVATLKTIGASGGFVNELSVVNTGVKAFDKVWDRDISSGYNDETTDAGDVGTADVTIFRTDAVAQGDQFFVGSANKFSHILWVLSTLGTVGSTLTFAYSDGAAGWPALTLDSDSTNALKAQGEMAFTPPGAWATEAVNGSTQYWIRITATVTEYTVAPVGTQVLKGTQGSPTVTVYRVNNGGTAGDTNAYAKSFIVPSDGLPVKIATAEEIINLEASGFIAALSSVENQIAYHLGGVDFA